MQDQWLIVIGWAQLIVFVAKLGVFWYQALKLRQTVKAASDQSVDMKASIAQATRAADAMEKSARAANVAYQAATESVATIKDAMGRQQRAYLCVNFGTAI